MSSQVQIVLQQVNDELKGVGLLLTENPHLELGSQPEVINNLLSSLNYAQHNLTSTLSDVFTLEQDVVTANAYLQLMASFDEAISFIQAVKVTHYGSLENTSNVFGLVEKCYHHLLILSDHCKSVEADGQSNDKEIALSPAEKKQRLLPNSRTNEMSLKTLFGILLNKFNQEELKELCFHLDIPYDDLSGGNRRAKARELVEYLERVNRIQDLVDLIRELRPQITQ